MEKNRIIKILGNIIGNVVVHKILVRYTNKPESVSHLTEEIGTYRDNALEIAQEFNWSEKDKIKIKQESSKNFDNRIKKYPDVEFPKSEVSRLIDETSKECVG
ncbi:MAG: hypothetical protein NT076_02250 [Candidatus Pacearchaeota archaeon]|nr:hypothetical protein [Candidatus Pacearchaeota archaeon]